MPANGRWDLIRRLKVNPFAHVLVTVQVKADFPSSSSSGTAPLRQAGFVPTTSAYFKVSPRSASSIPHLAFIFPRGVKLSVSQYDHLPPSSTEVKNEWCRTSIPLIYLHAMDMDNFAFPSYAYL